MTGREVLKTESHDGYNLRRERLSGPEHGLPEGDSFVMVSAFTPAGDYIGDEADAESLVARRGIAPELANPRAGVCSVGFCIRDQKWYGWSHRAICGFGIGDQLYEELFEGATDATPFIRHGDVTIETLDQARLAAVNFADAMS